MHVGSEGGRLHAVRAVEVHTIRRAASYLISKATETACPNVGED